MNNKILYVVNEIILRYTLMLILQFRVISVVVPQLRNN